VRLAVDIGGTFVDAISYDEALGTFQIHKASTTPEAPARGVLDAIGGLIEQGQSVTGLVHGTTLGLNAILQRSGAAVGIITNEGFSDLLEIARAAIPAEHMYNFSFAAPPPLVPRRHRIGVPGRIDARGRVLTELDQDAVLEAGRVLVEEHGLRSLAICFLHSYINPDHERTAAALLRDAFPGTLVSASSDITREYREYERTSTVTLDAYIAPVMNDYIAQLETGLTDRGLFEVGPSQPLHIMRSGGGAMTADLARRAPLTTVLSGPAGGVVGASHLAREMSWPRVLTFDVGGTTLDACVIQDGAPSEVHEASIDGFPLLIPIFDIRSVGAGGGSIAWMHEGLLRVGPRSAGAVPGPAAYGRGGTEPTITDACLVLGYLDAAAFLAGEMSISTEAAHQAVESKLAGPLGFSAEEAAASVLRVLMARTVGALREITVERGLDPREFSLLAFGGAGPLLGPMLAREMEIATTVIPQLPAAFSALGMLMSDIQYELSTTILRPLSDLALAEIEPDVVELTAQAEATLLDQGLERESHAFERILEARYQGQEHALPIIWQPGDTAAQLQERFNELHTTRHGHAMPVGVQVLAVRIRAVGRLAKPELRALAVSSDEPAEPRGERTAYDVATAQMVPFALYDRGTLAAGQSLVGPAIVEEGTSTTVLFSDQQLTVDPYGALLVTALTKEST
jgi:N-methylhydantoinase A